MTVGSPVLVVFVLSILLTIIRYSFQDFIKNQLSKVNNVVPRDKRQKFSESAWKIFYYLTMSIWCLQVVVRQNFFWDTKLCWIGWPNIPIDSDFEWFYLVQLSFYIHSFFAHVTIEVRRSDYYQMIIHHVVSFCLIGFSYYHHVYRIGGILLALHDINDVLLELSKLTNYMKGFEMVSNILFVIMTLVWTATRMTLFPIKVLGSIYYEVFETIPEVKENHYTLWAGFMVLLIMLQALNVYWYFLILRIAKNAIYGQKAVSDEREE